MYAGTVGSGVLGCVVCVCRGGVHGMYVEVVCNSACVLGCVKGMCAGTVGRGVLGCV